MNIKKIIILVLLISLVTRIFYLFISIPSLSNDEADLYLSSYLVAKSGTDFYNNTLFFTSGILTAKPSVPIYIGALSWLLTQEKSVFNARLLFALINSLTPVFFFLTIYLLTKDKKRAFISFFILNFSPWFSYFSVTGYESLISFLFLNGALCLAVSPLNKRVKLVSLICIFFFIFNSYMAIRTYVPFLFVLILFLAGYFNKKRMLQSIFFIVSIAILSTTIFSFLNLYAPNSQLVKKEFEYLISNDRADIEGQVWYERLTTRAPSPIKKLLVNKITVRIRGYAEKYLSVFDTNIFFIKGDPSSLYGTAGLIGLFYLSDFLFLLYGLMNIRLIEERTKYILLFFAIGTIPIALTRTTITMVLRGIILLIPFTIIITHGVTIFLKKTKKTIFIFASLVALNWISFIVIYTTRIAPLNASAWQMNQKNLIMKLDSFGSKEKVLVIEAEPKQALLQYAFYKVKDPHVIKDSLKRAVFTHENIEFTDICPKEISKKYSIYIMNANRCSSFINKYIVLNDSSIAIQPAFLKNVDMSGDDFVLIQKN